jgi:glycosyltransferase involved in cell wall biosynthesis
LKTFATLFPRLEPVVFNKGVGRIAYHMSQDRGWRSILAYCEHIDSPLPAWYSDEVTVHRLGKVDLHDRLGQVQRLSEFLLAHAESIDLLNLYDIGWETALLAKLYKTLNPSGTVFVKTDMDQRAVDMLLSGNRRTALYLRALALSVDFVTVETQSILDQVTDIFKSVGIPAHLLPIGFAASTHVTSADLSGEREKIVIAVGRTGSPQKHNELLIEAVGAMNPESRQGLRVVWIGDDELGFRSRAKALLTTHDFDDVIFEFVDHLWDREELFSWYRKASVFALSSRWESFATVLSEAAFFGLLIVSTRVGAAMDITKDGQLGFLAPPEDALGFARALEQALAVTDAGSMRQKIHEYAAGNFTWTSVVASLERIHDEARQ